MTLLGSWTSSIYQVGGPPKLKVLCNIAIAIFIAIAIDGVSAVFLLPFSLVFVFPALYSHHLGFLCDFSHNLFPGSMW